MRAVFGIEVSKPSSEMAILVNGEKVRVYTIPNDSIDFNHLLDDLKTVQNPENFFEVTGQSTVRKTDKIDTEKIALSQFVLNRKPTYFQEEVYQNLRNLSYFYQNLTGDIVRAKNRLLKVL